jgi:5'-AMP-activated protein kinase catalytic alpha subunit
MTSSIPGNMGMIAQYQHGRRTRRWYLGIQSKKDPAHVMTEVYKALMSLGCEWLQLSSYRIKCRWRPNFTRSGSQSALPSFGSLPTPSAGGETPQAAWNRPQGNMETESGVADMLMDLDQKDRKCGSLPSDCRMKVVSGDDGHSVRVPNLSTPDYCVKIGLTLYKVQQNIYLLDFQKMTGDPFSFMTLCANIITELKTLSAASKQQQMMTQPPPLQQAMHQSGYPPHHPHGMQK